MFLTAQEDTSLTLVGEIKKGRGHFNLWVDTYRTIVSIKGKNRRKYSHMDILERSRGFFVFSFHLLCLSLTVHDYSKLSSQSLGKKLEERVKWNENFCFICGTVEKHHDISNYAILFGITNFLTLPTLYWYAISYTEYKLYAIQFSTVICLFI